MEYTNVLKLKKPGYDDPIDVKDLNDNFDKIDTMDQRVSNLINTLNDNPEYAQEAEIVDIRSGYDGTIHETAGDAVRAIGSDLKELSDSLDDFKNKEAVDGLYYEDNKLYLTANGEVISDPIEIIGGGGGGGGGGTSSVVKLVNENDGTALSAAYGAELILKFRFTSTEDDIPTGAGTATLTINGAKKPSFSIEQGSNAIDIKDYLSEGSNIVKLTCTDVYGMSKSLTYSVNIIALSITSNFDDTISYDGDITFKFTPIGLVEKLVKFEVDGELVSTMTVSASGKQNTKVFSAMPHGAHKLVVWAEATASGSTIYSNRLVYDIICIGVENTVPIIASPFEQTEIMQGELIEIPFSIYDPNNLTANAELSIIGDGHVFSMQTRTVDRTRQVWSTRTYPVGIVEFKIACGNVEKSFTVNVTESNIPVEAETEDLTLYLTSTGRNNNESNPAVWSYDGVTTTFENVSWVNTGWATDEIGDTVLRLSGEARATVNMTPFSTDARIAGKTIEFEYAIRDVSNRDAVAISCMDGGIGFEATADRAVMKSEQSSIDCRYKDGEKIRVTFTIEPRTDYRLMCVYLNGILSGAIQYPENDNFQQPHPVGISFGSDDCAIDVYAIRVYDAALTEDQVRDNYIADTMNILEKRYLYEDNDIYDAYGNLSYDALVDKIPVMVVVGQMPTYKGDKKNVNVAFTDPFHTELNFEDSASIDVQGTSSQWFIRKNWKIKTSSKHQHAPGQLEAKVFCMKADYAEATGTHNTGNANFVHTLYTTKTPPQLDDERIRTTVFGFPCVMFHKEDENAEPVFIGKYNFNFDKGAENVYGFSEDYPLAESWEFCNNTSDACLFHGELPEDWSDDFEARYPDGCDNIAAFKTMHDWVVSTYQGGATNAALSGTYTDIDGVQHTNDTAAYRLAKFKTEFDEHFDKPFATLYYVYTLVMLMVDQRAKNMFLTTWDGIHWQPWLYDNDTCLGINNEGALVFDYYHEDIDQLGGANVYNGQNSTLWVNFREAFGDDIKALYQQLRSSGKLTFKKIFDYFITNHADKWSISVYNEDADYKYISMLRSDNDASNLSQIRGKGKEHLGYIVDGRLAYFDSKFYAMDYANDYVTLRIYTPENYDGIVPNANITVTPFSNMYAGVRYKANGTLQQVRAQKNTATEFVAPNEKFNDTETAIYGASNLSSVGNLAPLYCGSVKVEKASKLKELIIGSDVPGYKNTNLVELAVGTNKLLRKIDVTNCPNLTEPMDLSKCPNIEEIYARGSGITAVNLPASGYLKKMYLPGTITNLTLQNQNYITDFRCEGYGNLTTLRIENMSNIDVEAIINSAPKLNRVRLLNIDCTFSSIAPLMKLADNSLVHGLDENGNNIDNAVVTGKCYIENCNVDTLPIVQAFFPYLDITYGKKSYTVTYKSYDGTVVYVDDVPHGTAAKNPYTYGHITDEQLAKPADKNYTYQFNGWDKALNNITANTTVNAVYTQTARMYEVKWVSGDTTLETLNMEYGTKISKNLEDEDCPHNDGEYVFGGWKFETYENGEVIYSNELYSHTVGGNTVATAMWYKIAVPSQIKAFADCDWGEIKAVSLAAKAGTLTNNNGVKCDISAWWDVHNEKVVKLSTDEEIIVKIAGFYLQKDENGDKIPLHLVMKHGLKETRQMNAAAKYVYGYKINGEEVAKSTAYTYNYVGNGNVEIEFTGDTWLTSIVRTVNGVSTTWLLNGSRKTGDAATRVENSLSQEDIPGFTVRSATVTLSESFVWDYAGDGSTAITIDGSVGNVGVYDVSLTNADSASYRAIQFRAGSKITIPMGANGIVVINARSMWNAGGYFNSDLCNWINNTMFTQLPPILQKIIVPFALTSNIGGLSTDVQTKMVNMAPPLANELNTYSNSVPYTTERPYSATEGRWPCYTDNNSRIITLGPNGAASYAWTASAHRSYTGYFVYVFTSGGVYNIGYYAFDRYAVFLGFGI